MKKLLWLFLMLSTFCSGATWKNYEWGGILNRHVLYTSFYSLLRIPADTTMMHIVWCEKIIADSSSIGDNYWSRASGVLSPKTSTDDVNITGHDLYFGTTSGMRPRINGYWSNGISFCGEAIGETMYYMFSGDSMAGHTRTQDAEIRVYGSGAYIVGSAPYLFLGNNGTIGYIGADSGDLYLYSSGSTGNHIYMNDTLMITTGFYLKNLFIDSANIVSDSLIFWKGSDSWGIKKR